MSPIKKSVMALTESAARDMSPGWVFNSKLGSFSSTPARGIEVILKPNWIFKGWIARTEPRLDFFSDLVSATHNRLTGKRLKFPIMTFYNEQFWRSCGQSHYPRCFTEDLSGLAVNASNLETSEIPEYIALLRNCADLCILPKFNTESEMAFITSCHKNWAYYNPLYQQSALSHVLTEMLRGNENAAGDFLARGDIPDSLRVELSPTFAAYQKNYSKLQDK